MRKFEAPLFGGQKGNKQPLFENSEPLPVITPTSLGALPWLVAFTTQAPRDFAAPQDSLTKSQPSQRHELAHALAPLALTWLSLEHGAHAVSLPAANTTSPVADAALVVQPGFAAALTTADCLPLIVACPSHRVAAVIHAGWRGLAAGVIENTLDALALHLGELPGDTLVWVGPAIQQAHYEIGPEVRHELLQSIGVSTAHFKELSGTTPHRSSLAAEASHTCTGQAKGSPATRKYLADLPAIATAKLLLKGIDAESIELYPHSTFSHTCLHSVRRDGTQAGRMATVVGIRV
ncbi:MAG: polyphenol oxidase family protein [Coriobacteriales bacterium]|jgi:YfiH family protein|nr:polyphenol oxidase family protein [Coriobacteriales bacterium]